MEPFNLLQNFIQSVLSTFRISTVKQ